MGFLSTQLLLYSTLDRFHISHEWSIEVYYEHSGAISRDFGSESDFWTNFYSKLARKSLKTMATDTMTSLPGL